MALVWYLGHLVKISRQGTGKRSRRGPSYERTPRKNREKSNMFKLGHVIHQSKGFLTENNNSHSKIQNYVLFRLIMTSYFNLK